MLNLTTQQGFHIHLNILLHQFHYFTTDTYTISLLYAFLICVEH